jgi:hypothetical protein
MDLCSIAVRTSQTTGLPAQHQIDPLENEIQELILALII